MVAPEVQGEVSLGSQKKLGCGAPTPQQILVPHAAGAHPTRTAVSNVRT
jgi:hypothetical protein